jgi:hypothetical protein
MHCREMRVLKASLEKRVLPRGMMEWPQAQARGDRIGDTDFCASHTVPEIVECTKHTLEICALPEGPVSTEVLRLEQNFCIKVNQQPTLKAEERH